MDDSDPGGLAVSYQIREYLAGQVIAEYRTEAPTSYRAAEQATKRVVTLHRSGNYFLEVTDESNGRVFAYQYADLLY